MHVQVEFVGSVRVSPSSPSITEIKGHMNPVSLESVIAQGIKQGAIDRTWLNQVADKLLPEPIAEVPAEAVVDAAP